MANKLKSYTLCDTRYEVSYESYVDYCECNEVEPQGEDSEDFYDYVALMQTEEWTDLKTNLKYAKGESNEPCVILGSIGTWQGNREIQAVVCDNVLDAITKCFGSCDDMDARMKKGVIEVNAYHHDGTNSFEIYKLSKKGIDAYNRNSDLEEVKDYMLAKYHDYLF